MRIGYAIDVETKQHRRIRSGEKVKLHEKFVTCSKDGWIPWDAYKGKGRPIPLGNGHAEIKLANGIIRDDALWWDISGDIRCRVVAYRPICKEVEENLLPDVGTRVKTPLGIGRVKAHGATYNTPCIFVQGEGWAEIADEWEVLTDEDVTNAVCVMLKDIKGSRQDNAYDTCKALFLAGYTKDKS